MVDHVRGLLLTPSTPFPPFRLVSVLDREVPRFPAHPQDCVLGSPSVLGSRGFGVPRPNPGSSLGLPHSVFAFSSFCPRFAAPSQSLGQPPINAVTPVSPLHSDCSRRFALLQQSDSTRPKPLCRHSRTSQAPAPRSSFLGFANSLPPVHDKLFQG